MPDDCRSVSAAPYQCGRVAPNGQRCDLSVNGTQLVVEG
jgi:hypothetical protein